MIARLSLGGMRLGILMLPVQVDRAQLRAGVERGAAWHLERPNYDPFTVRILAALFADVRVNYQRFLHKLRDVWISCSLAYD